MTSKVEAKFQPFKKYFKQHHLTHCDRDRIGDVVPNVFCQINGEAIDLVFTCCLKNKYHYLVNGKIGHGEVDIETRIRQVQKFLNALPKNCPTCARMGEKNSPLKARYIKKFDAKIKAYYDQKYNEYKNDRNYTCDVNWGPLTQPVVPCKQYMHGFVNLAEAKKISKCLRCTQSKPEQLEVHTFLKYAVKRWQDSDEGKAALKKDQEEMRSSAERQRIASKNPQVVDFSPPVKPPEVQVLIKDVPQSPLPTQQSDFVRKKAIKRICNNTVKLIVCIVIVLFIGLLFVQYKGRIWNHRLMR